MDGVARGGNQNGGLTAVEMAEHPGKRHLAAMAPMARGTVVVVADRVPARAHKVVSCQAAKATVGMGEGLWWLGERGFWGEIREEESLKAGFGVGNRHVVSGDQL